ncbi:MAG: hypothetical protein HFG15_01655 [Bacilli bacterium]|jgi:hypothetical protein|nr:hypothetical protein [Bacilli bacterium]
MKQSIGSVFLYNIIIVFIILIFAFLSATISYSKAFRVNSKIMNYIERYEGYNTEAIREINRDLNTIGYRRGNSNKCASSKNGGTLVTNGDNQYKYCVYRFEIDSRHYSYGVLTYMDMDIPIISQNLEIPVYSKTDKIYKFKK